MSDYAWIALIIISVVVGNWLGEMVGWSVFGAGILIGLYLKRAERIREQEVRMAEAEAQKRNDA